MDIDRGSLCDCSRENGSARINRRWHVHGFDFQSMTRWVKVRVKTYQPAERKLVATSRPPRASASLLRATVLAGAVTDVPCHAQGLQQDP